MDHSNHRKGHFLGSRSSIVLLGFLAIAAFYLVTEHQAHLFGILPWLLLLACPLLHLFHGGHGGHGGGGSHQHDAETSEKETDR